MARVMTSEARRARLQRRLTDTKNRLEEARAAQAEGELDRALGDVIRAVEFLVDVLEDDLISAS